MAEASASAVSVIIPAYNAVNTLRRAYESVVAQTYPVSEIIIVDDGSADGTLSVARALGGNVRVLTQSNQGPATARNLGASTASGSYIAFLDADDYWYAGKLEAQMKILEPNPDLGLCCTAFQRFPTDASVPEYRQWDGRWQRVESFAEFVGDPYLGTPTVVMRKSAFLEAGGFDSTYRFAEDVDLWMRIASRGPIARIPHVFVAVATSSTSLTSTGGERADLANLEVLAKFVESCPDVAKSHRFALRRAAATVHTRLGSARLGKGEIRSARKPLARALLADPTYGRAWYLLLKSLVA